MSSVTCKIGRIIPKLDTDMNSGKPEWIALVQAEMLRQDVSLRELSRRTKRSHGGLSRNLSGRTVPETATIEKIADALGIERGYLLQVYAQDHPNAEPPPDVDDYAYFTKQLSEMPAAAREKAIDALSAVLDNMIDLVELATLEESASEASAPYGGADAAFALWVIEEFRRIDPAEFEVFEEKWNAMQASGQSAPEEPGPQD